MKNDIIREIWEIRGLVDSAVYSKDKAKYDKAQEKKSKLFKKEEYLDTISTLTLSKHYQNLEERHFDQGANFAIIAVDFAHEKKNLQGNVYTRDFFQYSSVLEIVWYTAFLHNLYLHNKEAGIDDEETKIIFESVMINLKKVTDFYNAVQDVCKSTILERISINQIFKDFVQENGYDYECGI